MTYAQTTSWMFARLPMYQNQGKSAYKTDLTNTIKLDCYLGHPHSNFKSIHIAGTNGKGSTSHMIASVLQEAGYKVGLYTSPHLKDFRERIKINGKEIQKSFVINFIEKHREFFELNDLSFFEMTVGMAFNYFAEKNVDIAVIEVGLGGRLDSTNIITPKLSVITNIGFDHTDFLGNTIAKIAYEKAGIIKSNVPVVIGETNSESRTVFLEKSKLLNASISFADQQTWPEMECDLKGNYQKKNIKTAMSSLNQLVKLDFKISERHLKNGLRNVIKNTGLKGRWQILNERPFTVCDTAHNAEGLATVLEQLLAIDFKVLHIVFGVVNDKDLQKIIPLMPVEASYYFCKPNVIRGMNQYELQSKFLNYGINGKAYESVSLALNAAQEASNEDDIIFIGGSTFVVAEII
ncbi:bifunctional folylpolyglutamate synthase/dihydrofolate synthase [Paucihalobacter sp.]|uniref:bifunctional folylpolyglutamate synthase/dihydrofolate synthase n=1 Tax=Paucihalobacter sp. TaxID=2850405 RepID=UPI002FE19902